LYRECLAGAQIIFPESGRGLGHVTPTIFGSTVSYPSDSLASCFPYITEIVKRTLKWMFGFVIDVNDVLCVKQQFVVHRTE